MDSGIEFTRHARDRSTARGVPPGIADLIIAFGGSRDAGDGALKHALTQNSYRAIKRTYGPEIAKVMQRYRTAYVVAVTNRIVTVAFARQPLFPHN